MPTARASFSSPSPSSSPRPPSLPPQAGPSRTPDANPPRPSLPPLATATAAAAAASTSTSTSAAPVSAGPVLGAEPLYDEPASARTAASSSSFAAAGPVRDDIEMGPIVTGHRRRKSSVVMNTNPVTNSPPMSSRPRSQSLRASHPFQPSAVATSSLPEEPKMSEEGSFIGSPVSRNEHDYDSFSDDDDVRDDEETGLTRAQKKRRRQKRRRNTLLDQRIVREKPLSPEEQKEVDRNVVKRIASNIGLILLWYLFSLSISLYNKWMFDEDRLNFAFPLFTTSMHMIVQFALSGLVLYFVPSLRPQATHESDMGRSRHESEPASGNQNQTLNKLFYFTRVGPCGVSTGLDIGLGNTSLKFISLTFYTMCKSSSLAFVLLFAFLFRLENPTWRLVAIIATMTIGVILMVFGEVEFHLGGFVLIISAAFFSGLRWGLTQILLLRHPATSNPFSSIFLLTPVMFFTLLGLAIPVEGFWPVVEGLGILAEEWGVVLTPLFLLFPGCLAFLMTSAEFALLQRTSVVTLSIAGIFKEVVTITAASVFLEEKLTVVNLVGLITTMMAIVAYNFVKITKMRDEARGAGSHPDYHGTAPLSSGSSSDADDEPFEETAGLLRPSADMTGNAFVTSDGDLQPNLISIAPNHEDSKEASALDRHSQ